jgi:hypothetical protein
VPDSINRPFPVSGLFTGTARRIKCIDSHGKIVYLMHVDGLDAEFCRRVSEEIIP